MTEPSATTRKVGRYEVLQQLGQGGMAVVYLARQADLDREVALKELSSIQAQSPESAQRFLREARLAGSLSHPNIVTVYEYFEQDAIPFIAMEYLPRGSLRPYVGHMTLPQVAGVLEEVLAGLAHAEQAGIVHRDLKPENIMVTGDGRVKIADFGIAKATQTAGVTASLTVTGAAIGTPTYMAPEQVLDEPIGPATDLYSLGIIAYELLCGRTPFSGASSAMAMLMRHVTEPVASVTTVIPELDHSLSDWIDGLLRKDPRERPQSAVAAWDTLEEIVIKLLGPRWRREARLPAPDDAAATPRPLTPAPFVAPRSQPDQPAPTPSRNGRSPRRRRGLLLRLAALGLVLVAGAVAAVLSTGGSVSHPRAATPVTAATQVPFSPYVDETGGPQFPLAAFARQTSVSQFTLAFILARGKRCEASWGGTEPLLAPAYVAAVGGLRAVGGGLVLSFGGQLGRELAMSCTTPAALAAQYLAAARAYHATYLDFAAEGPALSDRAQVDRRSAAIALVEHQDPSLKVWMTLPASTGGLSTDSLNALQSALAHGARIDTVNTLAFDFGDSDAPSPAGRMGYYTMKSATATQLQLANASPRLSDAQRWRLLGITAMIGVNDVPTEVFTLADARQVLAFARQHHVGVLSMWQAGRDRPCPPGTNIKVTQSVCSGVPQRDGEFSSLFAGYRG